MVNYCISKIGTLYLTEGLRAEYLTRYPGGSSICNTPGVVQDRDRQGRHLRAQGPGEVCGCKGLAEVGAGSQVWAGGFKGMIEGLRMFARDIHGYVRRRGARVSKTM